MFDYLISEEAKKIKKEVRSFVRDDVPHSLNKKMDKEEIPTPNRLVIYSAKKGIKRNPPSISMNEASTNTLNALGYSL